MCDTHRADHLNQMNRTLSFSSWRDGLVSRPGLTGQLTSSTNLRTTILSLSLLITAFWIALARFSSRLPGTLFLSGRLLYLLKLLVCVSADLTLWFRAWSGDQVIRGQWKAITNSKYFLVRLIDSSRYAARFVCSNARRPCPDCWTKDWVRTGCWTAV